MRLRLRSLALFFGALAVSCAIATGQEKDRPITIDDPASSRAVVARVGPLRITAREFLLNYEFGPSFAKRSREGKKRYLDFMINEKLLALGAMTRRDQVSGLIAPALAEVEGDLATEELYREDVQSKVKLSGKEIQRGVEESRRHVTLQWIYAPAESEARRLAGLLRTGATFDSLYRLQGPDSLLAANRLMGSTLFEIRTKSPEIALVADTLAPRRPSPPLKGADGWYILYIAEGYRDALLTESDQVKLHNDVSRALLQQKSDSLSDLYIQSLMEKSRPVIVPGTFDLVLSHLAVKHLRPGQADEWGIEGQGRGGRTREGAPGNIDTHGKLPLVTLTGRSPILLKEFLSWYRTRETLIKVNRSSKQAYVYSTQQMIWQMVRDRLLVDRAFKRNLQAREPVRTQKEWWRHKLLFEAEKRFIVDSISFHDNILLAYFKENERHYKGRQGEALPFPDARDDVLRDYYELEVSKRLLRRVNELKQRYSVTVDEKILARFPAEEGNPLVIDVYAVKKGGTFPRPAFPVIDMLWRSWN